MNEPRKRRWYQFSLRTLFVIVALIAAASWVVVDRQRLIPERDDERQRATETFRNAFEIYFKAGGGREEAAIRVYFAEKKAADAT